LDASSINISVGTQVKITNLIEEAELKRGAGTVEPYLTTQQDHCSLPKRLSTQIQEKTQDNSYSNKIHQLIIVPCLTSKLP